MKTTNNMENTNSETAKEQKSGKSPVKKFIWWAFILLFLGFGTYYYTSRFWAIGDKQTAGDMQSFGSDGRLIITHEGRLLTNELIADPNTGIAERVLKFSAAKSNDSLISFLNANVGKKVRVWYKKYSKPFFFRGQSQYVVYKAEPMP
jgi:hypothetical protein